MAAAGGERARAPARFVYVTSFGSHQCGGVLQLGGRRAGGRWSRGVGDGPRGAAAGPAGGGERPPSSAPAAPSPAAPTPAAPSPAAPTPAPASSARSGPQPAARAGLTQKTLAKKFDFPRPLNETSRIMKKKKKISVWNRVHKIISRMLEENEKYRLRLKCQRLSSENSNYTR